jgi:hypothetical protein
VTKKEYRQRESEEGVLACKLCDTLSNKFVCQRDNTLKISFLRAQKAGLI